MLRKSCLYLLLLLFSFGEGNGQAYTPKSIIDSLTNELATPNLPDTTYVKLLFEIGNQKPIFRISYWDSITKTSSKHLPDAQPIEEIVFLDIKAGALNNIGFIHRQHGEIDKALKHFFESLKIYEIFFEENKQKKYAEKMDHEIFLNQGKLFKKGLAITYNNIGGIYNELGDINKALEYFFLSLELREEIGHKRGMAESYNNIGLIYKGQGEFSKTLEYLFLSLKLREKIGDKRGMANSYNNIGVIYDNQGNINRALEHYFLSLKLVEDIGDKYGMSNSYNNIGGGMCELNKDTGGPNRFDEGLGYLVRALELNIELGYKQEISSSLSTIGGWELKLGKVEAALEKGLEALELAIEVGYVENIKRSADLLSDIYKKQGNFENALSMYELEIQMRDSILNEENTKSIIGQQMKYDYEKEKLLKEQEEKEQLRLATEAQSRRDDLHYAGIFIGMFLLFGVVMMLGFVKVPPKGAEAIIFLSFLILFEFLLVLLDPFVEEYTGGAPIFKLILNAVLAGLIFPLHQFFEGRLRKKLIKGKKEKISKEIKALMFLGLVFINPLLFAMPDGKQAQTSKVDSLKAAYEVADHDTTKVDILTEIGELDMIFRISYWDTIAKICNKNLPAGQAGLHNKNPQVEISFLLTKASALNNIGFINEQNGEIQKALEYYFESVKINEEFFLPEMQKKWSENLKNRAFLNKKKLFKKGLADVYNNIGVIYKKQGEIEKALEYFFLSLKIYEEIKDKIGMAVSYNNIGAIYDDQGEIEKALEYYFLSLKINEEIKDKHGMAYSYNNIGLIYSGQGEIEKGLEYLLLSLKIEEEIKDKEGMASSYHNIGGVLCKLDSLEEGMRYLELGLGVFKELGNKAWMSVSNSSIGGWQLSFCAKATEDEKVELISKALESGLEALALAKEIGHVDYMERAAGLLGKVYRKAATTPSALRTSPPIGVEREGVYWEKALEYYELEIQMRDSILNEENTKATIRQQMKYEHEKEQIIKEQQEIEQARIQAEVTSRRDNLQHSAIFIGILILFGGVLMLGLVEIKPKEVEGIIFISFLILFEFVLVLADPHIEQYTGGAPGYKLIFNAGIAGLMFPLHQFFEGKLKKRVIKIQRKKLKQRMEQYKKDTEGM